MSNIWLTSDTHFGHDRDFIWSARGFTNVYEMNEAIIHRWNSVVKPNDIVYHLGDVMLGDESNISLLKQLNGSIHIAIGNHDTDNRIRLYNDCWNVVEVQFGYRIKAPSKKVCILTHYPTIVSNMAGPKIFNFFGHTHQTTNFYTDEAGTRAYMYHVGVDSHNCTPVNLEDIISEIKIKEN